MPTPRRQLRRACSLALIASPENLWRAALKARRKKSRRSDVEAWWLRRETAINRLSRELLDGSWQPGGYRFFEIHQPKRRWIAAAPFEDRVVHHALCLAMQPLLERRFLARSFSCQIGKGTQAAREWPAGLRSQPAHRGLVSLQRRGKQRGPAARLRGLGNGSPARAAAEKMPALSSGPVPKVKACPPATAGH